MKYLIVGLGNIGEEYQGTRHNIGFMVIKELLKQKEAIAETDRYATTAILKHRGRQLITLMPTTYMNLSGKAVRYHMEKHKIPAERILIITDDIALPFGKLRLKGKGSDGGHNGLKSINELLATQQYPRMKIGVGSEFNQGKQSDYVLAPFSEIERDELPQKIEEWVKGILSFVSVGLAQTMNTFNRK